MIVIKQFHLQQVMEIFAPKYNSSSLTRDYGEQVALLHQGKVMHGTSPYIIVKFSRAKHLEGLRFAIRRSDVLKCAVGSNGRSPMYEVPMSMLKPYLTWDEEKKQITDTLESIGFWNKAEQV